MTNMESVLINDFPDIDLNRRYIVLDGWKLVDITYSKPDFARQKANTQVLSLQSATHL